MALTAVDARLGQRSPALLAAVFHVAKSITAAAASTSSTGAGTGAGGSDLNQLLRLLQRECATLIAQASAASASAAGGTEAASTVGAATLDAVAALSSSSSSSSSSPSSSGHIVCRVALVHDSEIALRVTSSFAHRDAAALLEAEAAHAHTHTSATATATATASAASSFSGIGGCVDEAVVADRVFPLGRGLIGECHRLGAAINVENPAAVRAISEERRDTNMMIAFFRIQSIM